MYNIDTITSAVIPCDCPEATPTKTKGRLTAPQVEAMIQIYNLNIKYPKRWFTASGELENVKDKTLLALIRKGYLHTRQSEANPKVRYLQYTGKPFEPPKPDGFKQYDNENSNK
jgi:hypothetical protein